MGGAVSELARSEGFKVTLQVGKRAVVARIAEGGAYRVSISGLGSLTREGIISSEQALTHHAGANAADIVRLMKAARELLNAAKP
jgi:hypothetical protein